MLPCVCSVIDHRWRQNVVRTKKWHTRRSRVCHWCSYHILTSSVIYYWTDARQHGIYLFYIITKTFFFISKYFNITAKAGLYPAFAQRRKKAIWRDLWSIQNEAISLVSMRRRELWLVEKNHATVKPDSSVASRGMKTYSKSRNELRNVQILKKMQEKSSHFLSSEQPCEPNSFDVAWKLQELKKYPRKTCGCGQHCRHSIRVLNERSVNNGGDFCGWWFSNQFDIVSETHLNCDTVGR